MPSKFCIRDAALADADSIADIYNYYIANTSMTFQEIAVDANYTHHKINQRDKNRPFIVAADNTRVLGFAYADTFRTRCAYRFVSETSIYVLHNQQKKGIGDELMHHLIAQMQNSDMCKLLAVITQPNPASIKLHENHGFVACGTMPAVGWKFNRWWDCGYWLLDLQKSPTCPTSSTMPPSSPPPNTAPIA